MMVGVADTPDEMQELSMDGSEQYSREEIDKATNITADKEAIHEESKDLLSAALERPNMLLAYDRVMRNKGAAGVDGMKVDDLSVYLKSHWPEIKEALLNETYQPQSVRKVEIPKPGGGKRQLGIPTVLDRLIQQALHQKLSRIFEPEFSDYSYGFRPGRNAGQAVRQSRDYVESGYRWVVDLDLEKFFDRVNHDILMSRVARQVDDKRVLRLVRAYLESGMQEGGLTTGRKTGTPQGGPLSPLLSNILLTDLDRELERRGHKFCRYADDCNIYVKSEAAGQRVLASITDYLEINLKLKVNREKSGVGRPWKRKFLGYSVCPRKYNVRLKVAPEVIKRFKGDLKAVFRRGRGRSIYRVMEEINPKIRGWMAYFRYIGVKGVLQELDGWIRRHLRKILWRQWKRMWTRTKRLMQLGIAHDRAKASAQNGRGAWWNAGASHVNQALPKKYFDRLGLVSLVDYNHRLKCLS
jgi:group II intron reverse transcriptase/maturase